MKPPATNLWKQAGAKFKVSYLGQEVNADGGLICVVERVVHEPGDQGGFANCIHR
jgi:hypothetical protein